jgi:hypothetical protein
MATVTDATLLADERVFLAAGDPRGELLRLDRELAALRRGDPLFAEALAAFDARAQAVGVAWCFGAGLREYRRVDLVARRPDGEPPRAMQCELHDLLGLPVPWKVPPRSELASQSWALCRALEAAELVVEHALRPADAAAAIASIGSLDELPRLLRVEARTNTTATTLESLRPALPAPLRRLIPQPPFNRAWPSRAPAEQLAPGERMSGMNVRWRVVLHDLGARRMTALAAIRHGLGVELPALREAVANLPSILAPSLHQEDAVRMVERLRELGARGHAVPEWSDTADPVWPEGPDDLRVRAGYPWLVEVVANDRALAVLEPHLTWVGPHDLVAAPVVRARVALDALLNDPGAHLPMLERAIDRVVATRRATIVSCRTCGKPTPPEWGGSECHACMERRGVVF